MGKLLIDYILDGGIRGKTFRGSDDDYTISDLIYERTDKREEPTIRAIARSSGRGVILRFMDFWQAPELEHHTQTPPLPRLACGKNSIMLHPSEESVQTQPSSIEGLAEGLKALPLIMDRRGE